LPSSSNISGKALATMADELLQSLLKKLELAADAGPAQVCDPCDFAEVAFFLRCKAPPNGLSAGLLPVKPNVAEEPEQKEAASGPQAGDTIYNTQRRGLGQQSGGCQYPQRRRRCSPPAPAAKPRLPVIWAAPQRRLQGGANGAACKEACCVFLSHSPSSSTELGRVGI
jgi:hypothetical protein